MCSQYDWASPEEVSIRSRAAHCRQTLRTSQSATTLLDVQSTASLRPDEITLFTELIDYHERSGLVGRPDEEFAVAFVGNDGDLTHPGLGHGRQVSMRTLRRFDKLDLIEILTQTDAAMTFGLADDFRKRWASLTSPTPTAPAVFISVAEAQKETLARPFRDLLAGSSVHAFIVSDEPLLENSWTPEQKVEAYLDRSNAVVVFATGDLATQGETYTRPNIADEIARARSRPGLRDRVCVLREQGVMLPSNINPAYEGLDPDRPEPAFRRALQQLAAWGLPVAVPPEPPTTLAGSSSSSGRRHPAEDHADTSVDHRELFERAVGRIPSRLNTAGEPSIALTVAGGPHQPVLRPTELEDPKLANRLTQELLFGDAALFDPSDGTTSAMSGNSLIIKQSRSWLALDAEGTVVVLRPLRRGAQPRGMSAVIEEDVRADIEGALRFVNRLLSIIDARGGLTYVAPVVALLGAGYGAWRTRAEQAASPDSMTMNMMAPNEPAIARLSPPARPRIALRDEPAELAADLTVLLRREVVKS